MPTFFLNSLRRIQHHFMAVVLTIDDGGHGLLNRLFWIVMDSCSS